MQTLQWHTDNNNAKNPVYTTYAGHPTVASTTIVGCSIEFFLLQKYNITDVLQRKEKNAYTTGS